MKMEAEISHQTQLQIALRMAGDHRKLGDRLGIQVSLHLRELALLNPLL